MNTTVKAVKNITLTHAYYIWYLGEKYTTVLMLQFHENQITEVKKKKTQTDYKLLSLTILVIFGQLWQNEYK